MTADVSLKGVSRRFGAVQALKEVSLQIDAGEYIVLLGPSGCGKSTLLSIIGGFVGASAGQVLIGGRDMRDVPPAARPTTTMFQDYALFPHMSLRDNVAFGLRMRGIGRRARAEQAEEFLALVGLQASAARRPHELSGGQRQRVALARALAVKPDILLLDEPLGALDLSLRRQMQDELKAIQRAVGTTFVHVTHDQEEAMAIADRIVVMNQGRIEDVGTTARIYQQPATRFTADFMGDAMFLPGQVHDMDVQAMTVKTETSLLRLPRPTGSQPALAEGKRVLLCLRPEQLQLDIADVAVDTPADTDADEQRSIHRSIDARLTLGRARVIDTVFFGAHVRCHLQPHGQDQSRWLALLPADSPVQGGDEVTVSVSADAPVVLPERERS